MFMHLALIAALATLAGEDQRAQEGAGEQQLASALQGRVANASERCIQSRGASSTIVEETALIFESGGVLYVNRPEAGAEMLDDDAILLVRRATGQLCRGDLIDLVDRSTRAATGFVRLGDFVPYRRIR